MCKNWFRKTPINWEHHNKVALLFGKNNTHYGSNKLSFCVNDIDFASLTLIPYGFQMRYFADSDVTCKNFRNQLTYAFTNAVAGDVIYIKYSGHGSYIKDVSGDELDGLDETLYMDGHFTDDEIGELTKLIPEGVTVIFSLDCCYSGPDERSLKQARFMPPKHELVNRRHINRLFRNNRNHIVFSGCMANEVSEEGLINGEGYGIFTYMEMTHLRSDFTYRKWFDQIRVYLPNKQFTQTPMKSGPDYLLDRLVFQ